MNTRYKHSPFLTKLSIALVALIALGLSAGTQASVHAQSDAPPTLEGWPYEWKTLEVSDYFTEENLLFNAETNPLGIFTLPDDDTTSASDAQARQELVALNKSGAPSFIRYIDIGNQDADPIVFFHGLPTFSYVWRDMFPSLLEKHRIIAFDQIGQGFSSNHDTLSYTAKQHLAYTEAFMAATGLNQEMSTFVLYDTGGFQGFPYAARHPEQIKGLAFFETAYGPLALEPSQPLPPFANTFLFLRGPGNEQIITDNIMVEAQIVNSHLVTEPNLMPFRVNAFTPAEIEAYQAAYAEEADRRALAKWMREVPIPGDASDGFGDTNLQLFGQFANYLMTSDVPKLYFHGEPGFINSQPLVDFVKGNLNTNDSLTAVNLGPGYHYLQADYGTRMGQEVADWLDSMTPQEQILINDYLKLTRIRLSYDREPQPNAPAGVLTIRTKFKNVSQLTFEEMLFEVKRLTGGNILLNADEGDGGAGSILRLVNPTMLAPGERMSIDFEIGLARRRPFALFVDAYGFVADGVLAATRSDSLNDIEFQVEDEDFTENQQQESLYFPLIAR